MSERNVLGMHVQLALATAVLAALAVPVLAQSGGGIAGVLPAGAVPELVKEESPTTAVLWADPVMGSWRVDAGIFL